MRIIVTGSAGRLGAAVCRVLAARHTVTKLARPELDLASPESVARAFEPLDFDVVINCAAMTNVDYCETHPDEAMRVNASAVNEIATIAKHKRARLVHISTDYVFDGSKRDPYTEEDAAQPISHYGASKLAGEVEALNVSPGNLVARVSWVFGPDRPSFVEAILQRAMNEEKVAVVADKVSSPSYAPDLARYLECLIESAVTGGIVHLCNNGACTWLEYGQQIVDSAAAAGVPLRTTRLEAIALAQMKRFVAARPLYTAMATGRFTHLTGVTPRGWREAVDDYVRNLLAPELIGER